MKGKVCGDFCEFTLDKGHFITGVLMETKQVTKEEALELINAAPGDHITIICGKNIIGKGDTK